MKKFTLTKWILAFVFSLVTMTALAAVPEWKIVPTESSITFTGIQNGAPASGSFKKFTGQIQVDPNQLNASKVQIIIDMNSLATTYSDFTSTLISADWFNVKLFPEATFEATHFSKTSDNKYTADGTITIRDKKLPVTITFITEQLSNNKERITGSATLKRTAFGVGQGEWADTTAVKDDVQVNFVITMVKK